MSKSLKQSKIQIQNLPQLVEFDQNLQSQVKGGRFELLTNSRHYYQNDDIDNL